MTKSAKPDGWNTATRKGKKTNAAQSELKRRLGMKKLQEETEKSKKKNEKMDIQEEDENKDEVRIKQELIDENNAFAILSDDEDEEYEDIQYMEDSEIEILSDEEEDKTKVKRVKFKQTMKNLKQSDKSKENKEMYNTTELTTAMIDALDDMEKENASQMDEKQTNNKHNNNKDETNNTSNKLTEHKTTAQAKKAEEIYMDVDDTGDQTGNEKLTIAQNTESNLQREQETGKAKMTKGKTQNQEKVNLTADEETAQDIMKKRGEMLTEDRLIRKTKMKFEFNIDKNTLTFNIRKAVQQLIEELRKEDPTLKVKSSVNKQEWGPEDDLPIDEKFHQHFATKEQAYSYSANKAYAYATVITKVPFHVLKWKQSIIDYLKKNKIWLKEDHFHTELTSSPGYFTNIHPKATWKDDFAAAIEHGLRQITLNKENAVAASWLKTNVGKETDRFSIYDETTPIPRFALNNTVRKWGNVSTDVIGVECDKKDAQYMKHILSLGAEQEVFGDAVFVPIGFHLIQGKHALEELLRQNNVFLSELAIIPIEGISRETMKINVIDNLTLSEKLQECNGIYKIEECVQTEEKGKWLILAQKNKMNQVKQHVEAKLNEIYSRGEGQTKMVGFTRTKKANEEKNSVVGTYAEVLKRMASSYDYKKNGQTRENYDNSHYQMRKRRNKRVDLTTNDKKPIRTVNNSEISTITNTTEALEERIQQLEKRSNDMSDNTNEETKGMINNLEASKEKIIKEMTDIINKKMEVFEKKQERKMNEITSAISSTVSESIMNHVTNQIESKFDGYMNKILKAVEKQTPTELTMTQHSQLQNQYYGAQQNYINPISQHMQTPQHIQPPQHIQNPLRFANPSFSYTPQTQTIPGSHHELASGPN